MPQGHEKRFLTISLVPIFNQSSRFILQVDWIQGPYSDIEVTGVTYS